MRQKIDFATRRPLRSLIDGRLGAAALALSLTMTVAPVAALAALGDCSQPVSNGATPVATDCLVVLQTAVFANDCNGLDPCVCAPKGSLPVAATDSLICLQVATGGNTPLLCRCGGSTTSSSSTSVTTLSTMTTTTITGSCPSRAEAVLSARVTAESCTTNADCTVGRCDAALGMCATPTDLDTGWTGIAHDADINDGVMVAVDLDCPAPFTPGAEEPCGVCNVTRLDPAFRNCRCSNDNRQVCTNTFEADTESCNINLGCTVDDDCKVCNVTTSQACNLDADCPDGERCLNGLRRPSCVDNQCLGTCECFFGPPLPLSSGNTPACVVNRFFEDVSGTANVDTGRGTVSGELRATVYLGELLTEPCPTCDGDDVANDGLRNGACRLGDSPGASCDAEAANFTFPSGGGGAYSLDCMPFVGKNVSGTGLVIRLDQTTGEAAPLPAVVECGFSFAPELCPCGACSGSTAVTCTSNAECAAAGIGSCTRRGQGVPRANQCSDGVCEDSGDGVDGVCANGPVNAFCDGALRSNGEPYVSCFSNSDCDTNDCGAVDCGSCSLLRTRPCFLDPIVAAGQADPTFPVGAATFCVPPTSSTAINNVAGLPGPARVTNQLTSTLFCQSDPSVVYQPGVGGCP